MLCVLGWGLVSGVFSRALKCLSSGWISAERGSKTATAGAGSHGAKRLAAKTAERMVHEGVEAVLVYATGIMGRTSEIACFLLFVRLS
jgi:hypothetical protein